MKKILSSTFAAAILLAGISTVGFAARQEDPKQPPPRQEPNTRTGENKNPPADPDRDRRITDETQKPPPETPKMPDEDDPK